MVINLWATWCVPCVDEMPSLAALSKTLAPDDIAVLPLSREPAGDRRAVQLGAELLEVEVALRDLPEEEVAVGADADRRVRAQMGEPIRPRLDDVRERLLAGDALLDRQPPPRGIDLEERVGDVLPDLGGHESDASRRRTG